MDQYIAGTLIGIGVAGFCGFWILMFIGVFLAD